MLSKFPLYICAAILALASVGCNSSGNYYSSVIDDTGEYAAYINTFSLAADTSVLANLDTVFFTIDLNKACVFNADSLPKGTNVSKLVVNIGLPTVSEAKLYVPGGDGVKPDTINYLENSTDTVCFSRGPVTLHLVSYNREVTRDYTISVNVHNVVSDTLYWNQTAQATLPTTLSAVTAQGTAEVGDNIVTLTTDGSAFARAVTSDPFTGQWQTSVAQLPAGADVQSLTAVGETLYLIAADKHLYSSTDFGQTWTDTGDTMTALLGANGQTLLGLRRQADGSYLHATYPAGSTASVSSDFPVSGFSQAVQFTTEWSDAAMSVITGGVTASGKVTGATWAYDGSTWARISNTPMPDMTGVTLLPYFTFRVNTAWVATKRSALMAFGGMMADGSMNRTTYVSYDQGVNWTETGRMLYLPETIPAFYGAQAFVRRQTMTDQTPSRAASAWRMMADRSLPAWMAVEIPAAQSRAVRPIEEWECPYIYLFGGYGADGQLSDDIWRGVINRLTFKPIQ